MTASRNWGGWLAQEVFNYLIGVRQVRIPSTPQGAALPNECSTNRSAFRAPAFDPCRTAALGKLRPRLLGKTSPVELRNWAHDSR
jgi:hypothetical protein